MAKERGEEKRERPAGARERGRQERVWEDRAPRVSVGQAHGPAVVVTRRAAERLRAGHLWVYRSDTEELIPGEGETEIVLTSILQTRTAQLFDG